MDEIDEMLQSLCGMSASKKLTYAAIFEEVTGLDMHQVSVADMRHFVSSHGVELGMDLGEDLDAWRDLIMTHFIEPRLPKDIPVFIFEYPASQAALAEVQSGIDPVALRFELFFNGIELANGYQELTDSDEQLERFNLQRQKRKNSNKPDMPFDHNLVSALQQDWPRVSGVALGIDRLIMLLAGQSHISNVLSFDFQRA
jgi:lysyl-tRNA synthetase class 2